MISQVLDFRLKKSIQLKELLSLRFQYYKNHQVKFLWIILAVYAISLIFGLILILKLAQKVKSDSLLLLQKDKVLEQTSKLALLGELTSGIGHEITSPITVLVSSLEQIKKKYTSPSGATIEDLQKHYEKSIKSITRITAIIKSIRSMIVEDHSNNVQTFNVQSVLIEVESILRHLLKKYGVELVIENAVLPNVYGLETETGQILMNLIKNAVEAMKQTEKRKIIVKFKIDSEQQMLYTYVLDSGPGVPHEFRKKIFDPLFSTKTHDGGTGIGLSYSKKVAHKMNADLKLIDHNFELTGACFELSMKLAT